MKQIIIYQNCTFASLEILHTNRLKIEPRICFNFANIWETIQRTFERPFFDAWEKTLSQVT